MKLALVAVVSAVMTATLVIGAGHALMGDDRAVAAAPVDGHVIQARVER